MCAEFCLREDTQIIASKTPEICMWLEDFRWRWTTCLLACGQLWTWNSFMAVAHHFEAVKNRTIGTAGEGLKKLPLLDKQWAKLEQWKMSIPIIGPGLEKSKCETSGISSVPKFEAKNNSNEGGVQTFVQPHSIVIEHKHARKRFRRRCRKRTAKVHFRKPLWDSWNSCTTALRRWTAFRWSSCTTNVLAVFIRESWWTLLLISTRHSNSWEWRHSLLYRRIHSSWVQEAESLDEKCGNGRIFIPASVQSQAWTVWCGPVLRVQRKWLIRWWVVQCEWKHS